MLFKNQHQCFLYEESSSWTTSQCYHKICTNVANYGEEKMLCHAMQGSVDGLIGVKHASNECYLSQLANICVKILVEVIKTDEIYYIK